LRKIVAAACIHIISTPFAKEMEPDTKPSLYAGQPIAANLTISTSFHWGGQDESMRRCILRFNVEEMVREWLISGPKRGDFLATVSHLPDVKNFLLNLVFFSLKNK
jgi:trafficking protein particle complex subunit 10